MNLLKPGMLTQKEFMAWLPPPYIAPLEEEDLEIDGEGSANGGNARKTGSVVDLGVVRKKTAKATANGKRQTANGKKRCTKCRETRPLTDFRPHDTTSDGYAAYCKFCQNELNKSFRDKNPAGRLKHHFATRVADQYGGRDKLPQAYTMRLEEFLGYKIETLVEALGKRLSIDFPEQKGVIECLKKGWHVDHIRPLSSFDTHVIGDTQFRECWAISNLRLVPADVNRKKGASREEET